MIKSLSKRLLNLEGNFIHHAFWIPGEWRDFLPLVQEAILKQSKVKEADLTILVAGSFLVENSRQLKSLTGRALTGETRCLLVAFDRINEEAQQALLKLLEEPPAGTVFILLSPGTTILLPTIISRLEVIKITADNKTGHSVGLVELSDQSAFLDILAEHEQNLAARIPILTGFEAQSARRVIANVRRWLVQMPHASPRLLRDYLNLTGPEV